MDDWVPLKKEQELEHVVEEAQERKKKVLQLRPLL